MLFFMPNNSKLCSLLLTDTLELFLSKENLNRNSGKIELLS
jgi:hypothetical protein